MMRIAVAIGSACLLAACSSHGSSDNAPSADITKISQVKSDFGPEFKVKDVPKTGIDPKVLATHKLPPGLKFDPPDCSSFVVGQDMPPGLQGNMAAVSAEGDGNRFIAMAVQTSAPVPFEDPSRNCRKVAFEGGRMRGLIEAVDAPQIDGVRTQGVHRVLQTVLGGQVDEPVPVERVAATRDLEVELEPVAGGRLRQRALGLARLLDGHAVLLRQTLRAIAGALMRRAGVELEATPSHIDVIPVLELLEGGFEATLADVAPRARDVRPDLDVHSRLLCWAENHPHYRNRRLPSIVGMVNLEDRSGSRTHREESRCKHQRCSEIVRNRSRSS